MTEPAPWKAEDSPWPVVKCTSPRCGAQVVFAYTRTDERAPFDARPDPEKGNHKLRDVGRDLPLAIHLPNARQRFGLRQLYVSHFATCPDAARYRRGKKTGRSVS